MAMNWQSLPGGVTQISIGRGNNAWGVDLQYTSEGWKGMGAGDVANVGVGIDGTVWYDEVFTRVDDKCTFNTNFLQFKRMKADGKLVQISGIYNYYAKILIFLSVNIYLSISLVGDKNHVWGVNRENQIFYRNGGIDGSWVNAADGTAWGVNSNDEIFRWNGAAWEQIRDDKDTKLKQVDTSNASYIVGTNASNENFQYTRGKWFKYDGSLKYVSISIDGILWGVSSENQVFTRQDGGFDGPAFK
ncbi:18729_t:CDS:2 [Racocetra fulgida]|uniref:18729_t:CDS:1 n=1 Tax=Racocetra fulgida TaxID=60492 RepID=A0A9N9I146_9GLOM|nr:18729_t:CDS:2 [Racocetra fulgida]